MRLLLDTHIFLWAVTASPQLKASTRRLIESAEEVYVSAVSIWEVAIKAGTGKLEADADELRSAIETSGFIELPISASHAAVVARLSPHHDDLFDRLLLAQALAEPLKIITADEVLTKYSAELVLLV